MELTITLIITIALIGILAFRFLDDHLLWRVPPKKREAIMAKRSEIRELKGRIYDFTAENNLTGMFLSGNRVFLNSSSVPAYSDILGIPTSSGQTVEIQPNQETLARLRILKGMKDTLRRLEEEADEMRKRPAEDFG